MSFFNIHINLHFTPDHTHQLTSSDCPSLWLVAERFSTDFSLWELNPQGPDFLSEKLPLNHFYQFVPGTRNLSGYTSSGWPHTLELSRVPPRECSRQINVECLKHFFQVFLNYKRNISQTPSISITSRLSHEITRR